MNLKQIANQIRRDFSAANFRTLDDGRIEFVIDGLKVRCDKRIDAVAAVADKYEKGLRHGGKTMAWPLRKRR